MFDLQTQLFEGQSIRLGQIDYEKDPEVVSRWTHDSEYLHMLELGPAYPLSPAQVKKQYEALEKRADEEKNLFHFQVRARQDGRLVGLALIEQIEWTNGNGFLQLGIGLPEDRGQGWGSEILSLLLRYAFGELNLFRVSAPVQEYNAAAIRLFQKFSFVEEVRRRQALHRYGRYWDLILFGQLRSEWEARK
jgi:RimJ/RimL family protein N-acetyltransferase